MKNRIRLAALWLALSAAVPLPAQRPPVETQLARLPRLGPVVYITAHPDDESAAVITYLARGLGARVVILSMTRGEGGQNQVGPELDADLARVRTEEFERAAAGYGAEVRFLGAADFGYSKSVEETFKIWDDQKLLAELVRQLRELKPLVVLSAWSGTSADGGGAHHQAAGLLARRAFELAGEPHAFPEQLARGYEPWQPRFLFTRVFGGGANLDTTGLLEVPAGQPSPVAGKSYAQLGWEAFQNHRSQGLHLRPMPQPWRHLLRLAAVQPENLPAPKSAAELVPPLSALPDWFPTVVHLGNWRERLAQVEELAENARAASSEKKDAEAALALVQGAALVAALRRELETDNLEALEVRALLEAKQNGFLAAAAALSGVELDAVTDRAVLTPGERAFVRVTLYLGRSDVFRAAGLRVVSLQLAAPPEWSVEPAGAKAADDEQSAEYAVTLPDRLDPGRGPREALRAQATLATGSLQLELTAPVRGFARAGRGGSASPTTSGPSLETVTMAPAVTLAIEPALRLVRAAPGETVYDWCVRVESFRPQLAKVSVWLEVPNGWTSPLPAEVPLGRSGQARACFSVTLPEHLAPGRYEVRAAAGAGLEKWTLARREALGASSEPPYRFEPARGEVEVLNLEVPPGVRVGFIGFNDDPAPALLAQLGIGVDFLDERALAKAALAPYDAVVVADRAYDYREDLAEQNARLLAYVKAGGTLLVEHQGGSWDAAKFAPFPAARSNRPPRVTDETAAVTVLAPGSPLVNFPNRIGDEDWKSWVQERGLYFWESWPEAYTPILEMADPGEAPQRGALLAARYGEGTYIYCGLALFRQLRAGVPGGVRLYVNLLSQRRLKASASDQR